MTYFFDIIFHKNFSKKFNLEKPDILKINFVSKFLSKKTSKGNDVIRCTIK